MISDEAARALDLISAIDLCKQAGTDFWRGMTTRIVLDLDDEPGAERMMVRVRELLGEMWRKLDDKPPPEVAVCPKCGTAGCLEDKALDW